MSLFGRWTNARNLSMLQGDEKLLLSRRKLSETNVTLWGVSAQLMTQQRTKGPAWSKLVWLIRVQVTPASCLWLWQPVLLSKCLVLINFPAQNITLVYQYSLCYDNFKHKKMSSGRETHEMDGNLQTQVCAAALNAQPFDVCMVCWSVRVTSHRKCFESSLSHSLIKHGALVHLLQFINCEIKPLWDITYSLWRKMRVLLIADQLVWTNLSPALLQIHITFSICDNVLHVGE